VDRVKILTYALLGVCVGIATVLYIPRLGSASPSTGLLWELEAIAAVIIGGTALRGGAGSVTGTVIGAVLLSVISNILNLTSIISVYLNAAVQGFVIIAVALFQRGRK
jgi:ribose transport system permease protein